MSKSGKIIKSANFKSDYVAFLAIILFFLIVIAELTVIVGIPIMINHTEVYADFEVKHELIQTFDNARRSARTCISKYPEMQNEAKLILWDLDLLAYYLRENQSNVKMLYVVDMLSDIQKYQIKLKKMSSPEAKTYLKLKEIDFELLEKNLGNIKEQ